MAGSPERVSSARAAEIIGIGYEGFRSYLKRGLLGRVGMLPGFHAADSATTDDPATRSGWQTFGLTDLTLMRLAKILMDAGFSFASVNSIVSRHELWSSLQHDKEPTTRYLMLWPPYGDYILYHPRDLHQLPADLAAVSGVVSLVNVGEVQRQVAEGLRSASV